jgi:aminoglycoside 3-N-acetyltransferase I
MVANRGENLRYREWAFGVGHVCYCIPAVPLSLFLMRRPPVSTATIHRVTPGELPLLHALLDVFGDAFEDPASYAERRPSAAYLQELLASDTFVTLVAQVDGRVVGGLAAYELRKFEQARSEFYIYDLAVEAAHRRRGIATALIRVLQEIAATRGGWVIFVQADHGDDPAIALYASLGEREEVLHFDIPVP